MMTGMTALFPGCLQVVVVLGLLSAATTVDAETIIRRGTTADAPTLDPAIASSGVAAPIINDLFEGLLGKSPTLEPIPGVAESWIVSKDRRTYTFKLRDKLKWSDGAPITADDVVFGYRRLMDPTTASMVSGQFYILKNGRDVVLGKLPPEKLGVRAIDPRTVEMDLVEPAPYFIELVAAYPVAPVPRHAIEKYGREWTRPGQMVSNGAYVLAERIPQTVTRLKKNPYFHDAASVRTDIVEWYPTQDLGTSLRRYRAGELDQILNFPPEEIDRLQKEMPQALKVTRTRGDYYLLVNVKNPPLNDRRVRRALSLAIDRNAIAGRLLDTGMAPATMFIGPDFSHYESPTLAEDAWSLPQRQARARELLKAAGFGPDKPLKFEYTYDTNEENRKIAIALAAMWQAVGAQASTVNVQFGQLMRQVRTGGFQVARWAMFASYDDPIALLQLYTSDNTGNYMGYSNPAYDRLLHESALQENTVARAELLGRAESLLMQDAPIIPIYYYARRYLVSPEVRGWQTSGRGPTPSRYLYVDRGS